ncbi:hypothetical protein LINPERHAP1_LOCUS7720 [Linum perenne]
MEELIDCVEPVENEECESQLKKAFKWIKNNILSLENYWPHLKKVSGGR